MLRELRNFEWNNDFDECRHEADQGNFDANLAQRIGTEMHETFRDRFTKQNAHKDLRWNLSVSLTFKILWTHDTKVSKLSERKAKVLFLAASDIFHQLHFGGRTEEERKANLKERISQLNYIYSELDSIANKQSDYDDEKYEDRWDHVDAIEAEYQKLYFDTIRIFGK